MNETPFQIPSNWRYVASDGDLQWIAAERMTVLTAGGNDPVWRLISQITFSKALGSIFVQFPYFSETKGILSDAVFEEAEAGKIMIRMEKKGYATTHHVKYHHPPDGRVHFSQDRRVRSIVRRQSFPLTESGLLWELHAYGVAQFDAMTKDRIKARRAYLPCYFNQALPNAVTVSGSWMTRQEVSSRIVGPSRGPFCTIRRDSDGALLKMFLVSAPEGFPQSDRIMLLNVGAAADIGGSPTMIFLGGWDSSDRAKVAPGNGCLTFMYPSGDHDAVLKRIASADFPTPAA